MSGAGNQSDFVCEQHAILLGLLLQVLRYLKPEWRAIIYAVTLIVDSLLRLTGIETSMRVKTGVYKMTNRYFARSVGVISAMVVSFMHSPAAQAKSTKLIHPQSGATAECSASGFATGVSIADGIVGSCAWPTKSAATYRWNGSNPMSAPVWSGAACWVKISVGKSVAATVDIARRQAGEAESSAERDHFDFLMALGIVVRRIERCQTICRITVGAPRPDLGDEMANLVVRWHRCAAAPSSHDRHRKIGR